MSLKKMREDIDRIDSQILDLLNQRAKIVQEVGRVKQEGNLVFHDPSREDRVLQQLEKMNPGPFPNEGLRSVFREIMSVSLAMEKPLHIAYLGPKATYTHLASLKRFGLAAQYIPARGIEDIFWEVERDHAEYGVVPVENSNEGIISHTLDMFVESELKICGEIYMEISHNLLSKADDIKQLKTVYSHRQPLAQSRKWIRENLGHVDIIEVSSTAHAAERAADDILAGAIAGEHAAEIYGLKTLKRRIEDRGKNITRFLITSKTSPGRTGNDKTSIIISVRDRVGALYNILKIFAENQVNLHKIESRPSKKKAWDYIFYVDMEGHLEDENIKKALEELHEETLFSKVLGSYPKGKKPYKS